MLVLSAALLLITAAPARAQGIGSNVPMKPGEKSEYDANGKLARKFTEDANGTRFVTVYNPDGKVACRRIEPPTDKKIIASLAEQEKTLQDAIDSAGSLEASYPKLRDLANFYLFVTHDMEKAAGTISALPPAQSFGLHLQLIEYDFAMPAWQRVIAFKRLMRQYPDNKTLEMLLKQAEAGAKHNWPIVKL